MDGAKERVEQERDELDRKLKSLGAVLDSKKFWALSAEMRMLLHKQFRAMNEYHQILTRRLEIWDKPFLSRYVPKAYCPKCRKVFADGEGLCECFVNILPLPEYPCLRIDIEEG